MLAFLLKLAQIQSSSICKINGGLGPLSDITYTHGGVLNNESQEGDYKRMALPVTTSTQSRRLNLSSGRVVPKSVT